ncbi:putative cytosolic Cu/Zn superoxide dismutase [Aspergillus stella-maris]|uniref:putative cytosolic Cu/Zn superoxide dismutase n=1 Tax=Aspergillus stella-maris TaxID=1810926 RepID=UPI003CCE2C71
MRYTLVSAAVAGLLWTTAFAGDAPVVKDNEEYSVHHAELIHKANSTIFGGITITASPDSSALHVDVHIGGINESQYINYHIHAKPVPEDGNCYLTGAHLDPYHRTQEPPCDIKVPQTCEVGDLSGKHGPAWAPSGEVFHASYNDFFLSNTPGSPAYFGNLSWVVHAPDSSRLTCGNFQTIAEGERPKTEEPC